MNSFPAADDRTLRLLCAHKSLLGRPLLFSVNLSLSFSPFPKYPSKPKMPPRGSEGYDFTPILTHYLFLFTTILAVVSRFHDSPVRPPLDAQLSAHR